MLWSKFWNDAVQNEEWLELRLIYGRFSFLCGLDEQFNTLVILLAQLHRFEQKR